MPGLTDDQLLQAISNFRGANAPVAAPPPAQPLFDPATLAAPGPAPVVVPPVQEMAAPPPAVEAALPPSAPAAYVVPATHNSREGMVQMDNAAAAQANAISEETAARAALEAEQAKLIAKQTKEQAQAMGQFQTQQAEGQARTQQLYDDSQKIESEASTLQARDRRTTSQRTLGMIGTALGGLADGLSGFSGKNTNFAQNIEKSINDAVEKDMAQQQAAIDGKHKQAAMKLTEFGIAHKLFVDDPKAAFEYASLLRKDMYAKDLEALTKRSANPIAVAQGKQASEKIISDNVEKKTSLLVSKENAREAALAASARTATTNPESPYEGMTQTQLQAIKDANQLPAAGQKVLNNLVTGDNTQAAIARKPEVIAQTKGAKLSEDQVVRDPAIAVQYADTADKFQSGLGTVRTMTGLIDAIEADRKLFTVAERAKDLAGMSEIGSRLESNGKTLSLEGKNAFELGALSGPDIGLINSVTGNVKSLTSGADTQLETMKANITRSANEKAFSRGLEHPFKPATPPTKPGTVQGIKAGGKAVDASKVIAPDTAGKIQVVKPDGTVGLIPADKLDLALSRGYKRAE